MTISTSNYINTVCDKYARKKFIFKKKKKKIYIYFNYCIEKINRKVLSLKVMLSFLSKINIIIIIIILKIKKMSDI